MPSDAHDSVPIERPIAGSRHLQDVFAARSARVRDRLAAHLDAEATRDAAASLLHSLGRRDPAAATAVAEHRRWIRLAEAAMGARLLDLGSRIDLEVPGPRGRTCDFLVARDGLRLAVHVKLLGLAVGAGGFAAGLGGRERALERIERPLLVEVRSADRLPEELAAELASRLREFILGGRVGEERSWRDARGVEIAGARVLGAHEGERVRLVLNPTGGFDRLVERARRLMRKAYGQFLPSVPNIVLFAAAGRRLDLEIERALLGSSVERWDLHPALGERFAHGRADDGFWQGGRAAESSLAGWFDCLAEAPVGRWWCRPGRGVDDTLASFLDESVGPRAGP